ncbi:outer membrane beta-barrel protein [Hymenobacter terrenus]|uniref:outer membrane beta-barrel protein n=1 Tax=Hymenobacter terrenus TaxID=1629124 RepID=UPI000619D543|nr:outer membrane beta-barrel protein [Hymenobacter terrenus]
MKFAWCTLLFTLVTLATTAQTPGTHLFKGRVTEANQQPVPFATVLLLAAADSSLVKAGTTDTTGTFAVTAPPTGRYRVRIMAMGFATYTSAPLAVAAHQQATDLGPLVLAASSQALGEVLVTGEKPAIEHTMGKTVLNVSNPLFKVATSALDVLSRAPGLIVNQEGAISVNGRYAPVVYIDGKQQPMTAEELRNLQADDIEQVEVINNASAQFDGETRAVINIKLKRSKTLGWKGSLYSAYSRNKRQNGGQAGGSATYKTKRWAYYGQLGYQRYAGYLTNLNLRNVRTAEAATRFNSSSDFTFVSKPLSYQFSADYLLTQNHQLGVFIKGNRSPANRRQRGQTEQDNVAPGAAQPDRTLLDVLGTTTSRTDNVAFDLNYIGTLNSRGDKLLAFADYATYSTPSRSLLQNDFRTTEGAAIRAPFVLAGQFATDITIRSLRADYSRAWGSTGKLELGTKLVFTRSANDVRNDSLRAGDAATGDYVYDASRSNRFRYKEQITAAYVQTSQTWGNTQLEAGLRVENTSARGNSLTLNQTVNRQYFRWLPSLKLQQKLNEQNSIDLSFSRKMARPAFGDLNPAPLYTDYYSYIEGNPFLLPVTHNTTNLTYTHKALLFSLNYVLDKDVFVQIPLQNDQTKVIRYTRFNLGEQQQYWFDVTAPLTLTSWWKTQHYAQVVRLQTKSDYPNGGTIDTQGWQFTFNGSQSFSLPKDFSLEVKYDYSSPTTSDIYNVYGNSTVSLGLQKNVLQKRGNVQLNVSDIFNTYRERFATQFQNIDIDIIQRRNSRQATLRFTYSFGQSTFSRKSQPSGSSEEESRAR